MTHAVTGSTRSMRGAPRPDRPARLAHERHGAGAPLVLLHGIGSSRRSWYPVLAQLAEHRDTIAVDLPGHGESPRRPRRAGHAPADLARSVADLLDELGLDRPDVVGNSLGGWVALELARLGRARSVTALSPGGLWRGRVPAYLRVALRQSRLTARVLARVAPQAPRSALTRALVVSQVAGSPWRVPYAPANAAVHDMAAARGFRPVLRALERRRLERGQEVRVPVTVAFGTRDRVLLPGLARWREALPPQTRWVDLPGLGHVPMLDDPDAVVRLVLESAGAPALG